MSPTDVIFAIRLIGYVALSTSLEPLSFPREASDLCLFYRTSHPNSFLAYLVFGTPLPLMSYLQRIISDSLNTIRSRFRIKSLSFFQCELNT